MAFIAGAYSAVYNSLSIGQLSEGITIHTVTYKEIITGDNLARGAQDAVFQGTDVTSDFTLMEWNLAGAKAVFWPYGTGTFLTNSIVGRLDVQQSLAKSLVLTAYAGPPAATLGGATVTLGSSMIHEDFPVDHILRSAHRKVPIRMRHYPDSATFASNLTALYGVLT